MLLCQRSELSVQLESDEIFLRGTANESAGATLRGTVILHATEVTKIKSIAITLQGKTKVHWSEGVGSAQRYYAEEHKIIEHTWDILERRRKPYIFTAGTFKWDFELPVPGDLPGSLDHELGQTAYQLKAVAERPGFSFNVSGLCDITVTRRMLPSSLEYNQSVVVSGEWPTKIGYNISLPRLIFSPGSHVPIDFDMTPLVDGLSIRTIVCSFEESITLSCGSHTLDKSHSVKVISNTKVSSAQNHWNRTQVFAIPEGPIRTDIQSNLINISHKIRVVVSLKNPDGSTSELRASIPFVIGPVLPEEDEKELPAYEDALKSLPYYPANVMTSPYGYGSRSSIISSGGSDESLSSEGDTLTRLPSYTTATRSNSLHRLSEPSLPTYDSILLSCPCTAR